MPVSWRWRLGAALLGVALLSHPVAAKIERFKDKEGALHITNTGEEPVKRGGVTTPTPPAAPAPGPAPTAAPPPPLQQPFQPPPPPPPPEQVTPPPGEPGEPPPVMEPEPNEPPAEPLAEPPAPEAGTDEGQVQANPGAVPEQAVPANPPLPRIPGQGGRGRGVYGR